MMSPAERAALRRFAADIRRHSGGPLSGIFLFGGRARGWETPPDHHNRRFIEAVTRDARQLAEAA